MTTALPQAGALIEDGRWQAARVLTGRGARLAALALLYLVVAYGLTPPTGVTPAGWRTTAVFLTTIAGLMLQPLAGAPLVLIGVTLVVFVGDVPFSRALGGFSTSSVWLVLTAMLVGVGRVCLVRRAARDGRFAGRHRFSAGLRRLGGQLVRRRTVGPRAAGGGARLLLRPLHDVSPRTS
ncbi:MAG: anion permease [Vicinamibacterales bacterium]